MLLAWLDEFRGLPRSVFVLSLARCNNTFGFSIVMPYLAFHLTAEQHLPMTFVGVLYTVAGAVGALAQLAGGELADRLGRRPVMLTCMAARALVMVALGVVFLRGGSVWTISVLVVVNAAVRAGFEPAAHSLAAVLAGEHARTAAFGLQRIGINLGWAIGPALGGVFAHRSYASLFFVAAGVTGIAALGLLWVRDPDAVPSPAARARISLADFLRVPEPKRLAHFLAVTLLASIVNMQLFSTLSVYAMGRLHIPEARFGLLYTINGFLVVTLQGPMVRVLNRIGAVRSLVLGPILYAAGYFLVGESSSLVMLGVAVAVITLGELLTEPAEMVLDVELGDAARPGRAMGVFGLVSSIGTSLGPAVGGVLYDRTATAPRALWGAISALALAVAVGYAPLKYRRRAEHGRGS